MKQIQIIGNIGRDAKHFNTNGNDFISFPVGVSETWKDEKGERQERTDWFSVITKQKALLPYLKKGTKIFAQGSLKSSIYHNEKANAKMIDLTVNATTIQLLSAAPKDNAAPGQPAQPANITTDSSGDDLPF